MPFVGRHARRTLPSPTARKSFPCGGGSVHADMHPHPAANPDLLPWGRMIARPARRQETRPGRAEGLPAGASLPHPQRPSAALRRVLGERPEGSPGPGKGGSLPAGDRPAPPTARFILRQGPHRGMGEEDGATHPFSRVWRWRQPGITAQRPRPHRPRVLLRTGPGCRRPDPIALWLQGVAHIAIMVMDVKGVSSPLPIPSLRGGKADAAIQSPTQRPWIAASALPPRNDGWGWEEGGTFGGQKKGPAVAGQAMEVLGEDA